MDDIYDLAIVGAGPAAMTAAIYAQRFGMKTTMIEHQLIGGQMATADRVENFPGFSDGIEGIRLAENMEKQARGFGADIKIAEATGLTYDNETVLVNTDGGDVAARCVLLATGSNYRHLGIPGEEEHAHYCATCDGAFYKNKDIVTIGGANSAVQEALYLSMIANHVTMLVRSYIKADQILKDRLQAAIDSGKITVMEGVFPLGILDDGNKVIGVRATNGTSEQMVSCDGVFIFAGQTPNVNFLHSTDVQLSENHYIVTDKYLHTSMPHVWAAGDVRFGASKQIVTAVSDGANAAINIHNYLSDSEA